MALTEAGTEMTASLKAVDGNADLPALMADLAARARAAARVLALASPEQKNRALDAIERRHVAHQVVMDAQLHLTADLQRRIEKAVERVVDRVGAGGGRNARKRRAGGAGIGNPRRYTRTVGLQNKGIRSGAGKRNRRTFRKQVGRGEKGCGDDVSTKRAGDRGCGSPSGDC